MESNREFRKPGPLGALWLWLEKLVNGFTTSAYNPLYYLGAITIFFMWIILVTGVYLFIFYNISATGAYASVDAITHRQWYLGGVMRSMHRYASDGLVIAMLAHALRCYVLDRYRHWRLIAWVSGVIIAWIVWIGGIFGYWMVWDEKGYLVAKLSAHLLENVPIFGLPLSLNFARIENLTDQLFYIVLFIHFSTIFFLFILIMIHISRITKSIINPPKMVSYGLVGVLLLISFIKPALSAPATDLKKLPVSVPFDWFYMFIFPLLKFASAHYVWLFIVASTAFFSIIPLLGRRKRSPAASVTLSNCVGCELCMEDCPYQAIKMRKRTDGMAYELEAVVMPSRCASCGLCVGACDYNAINLPDLTEETVKSRVRTQSRELLQKPGDKKVIVFACAKGAWLDGKVDAHGNVSGFDWARVVNLPCIGMLQPSMLSIPFEEKIDGVLVAGCRLGDCHYRRGNEWFPARLAGNRPPVVKRSIDRARVKTLWVSAVEKDEFLKGLGEFHRTLKKTGEA